MGAYIRSALLWAFAAALPGEAITWAAPASTFIDQTVALEFISIQGGCFRMGDSFGDGTSDEQPVHEVCVDGFRMGKYAVTVDQFGKFVRSTGYRTDAEKKDGCLTVAGNGRWSKVASAGWKNPGFAQDGNHPVVCVSWHDAVEFSKWLSRQSGRFYRLPTEAEWEYAARGGSGHRNFWGNGTEDTCTYANVMDRTAGSTGLARLTAHECDDRHAYTAPVGTYKPNPFGLYDMMGNVWQWTGDWYDENYYSISPKNNPGGPASGSRKVPRGGSWRSSSEHVRVSLRVHPPIDRSAGVGFRLVTTAD